MAKNRQIKATLVLSEGNFFTNVKRASSGLNSLKKNFDKNSSSMKKHAAVLDSTGKGLTSLAKKVVGVAAAYVSIKNYFRGARVHRKGKKRRTGKRQT